MNSSRLLSRILIALVSVVAGLQLGCQNPPVRSDEPILSYIGEVRPGDKLIINFADNQGIQPLWEQTVGEDGTILLPFNKRIEAAGLREAQLEQKIRDLYVPSLLTRLTVNVRLEQRTFFVRGQVNNPGQRELTGSMTAMTAIAAAGDFTDFANKSKIEVIRAGTNEKIPVDGKRALRNPKYDVPVYAGDTVFVHRRFF